MSVEDTSTTEHKNADDPLMPSTSKSRGRWMLLLLFAFFVLPLLLVVLMHRFDWHPQGSSHGELISPPRLLQTPAQLLDARGTLATPALWRDKWSMVYIADDCQQTCNDRLHIMRQLHVSLAKDISRVQRVLLTPSHDLEGIQKQYPDLLILGQSAEALAELRQQFDLPHEPAGSADRIYLVDPLGNLMMSYPSTIPAGEIRKDLTRLLAYAWAG
jgi:cytochrome oxidase Cu insertion factor (SCO1/SenC/PrrC family)